MTTAKAWTKCWIAPERLASDETPPFWVRHALHLCDRLTVESQDAGEISNRVLELVASHFCAREIYLIGAQTPGSHPKVVRSSPQALDFTRDRTILDYVFNTGLAASRLDDDQLSVAVVPLRRSPSPRVTGALVLVRPWGTPAFDRHDLELIGLFGHTLMSLLSAVLEGKLERGVVFRRDLTPSRVETETCRRSRLDLPRGRRRTAPGQTLERGRADASPLTLSAVFPDKGFQLPTYLEGVD